MKRLLLTLALFVGLLSNAQTYEFKDYDVNGKNFIGKVKGKIVIKDETVLVDYKMRIAPDLLIKIVKIEGNKIIFEGVNHYMVLKPEEKKIVYHQNITINGVIALYRYDFKLK